MPNGLRSTSMSAGVEAALACPHSGDAHNCSGQGAACDPGLLILAHHASPANPSLTRSSCTTNEQQMSFGKRHTRGRKRQQAPRTCTSRRTRYRHAAGSVARPPSFRASAAAAPAARPCGAGAVISSTAACSAPTRCLRWRLCCAATECRCRSSSTCWMPQLCMQLHTSCAARGPAAQRHQRQHRTKGLMWVPFDPKPLKT
eukprot:365677-Chlamydomonas_euryale.AAC.5